MFEYRELNEKMCHDSESYFSSTLEIIVDLKVLVLLVPNPSFRAKLTSGVVAQIHCENPSNISVYSIKNKIKIAFTTQTTRSKLPASLRLP